MLLSARSIALLLLLGGVVIFGVTGSYILGHLGHNFNECMDLVNSIYFTVVTLSTVGYGDIVPITPIAKIFVVVVIVFGMG
ncbi:MAG: ion channel [Acidianus sp.]|jgi:voltage-gated potassium channel|nr:ion channel [Acidianus sp.]